MMNIDMVEWIDQGTYWSWPSSRKVGHPPPSNKQLHYVRVGIQHSLCVGVWNDGIYTALNRQELACYEPLLAGFRNYE